MRRVITTIQDGDTTEIQWGTEEPADGRIVGYVQIDAEGRLIVPFRDSHDESFVFVLGDGNAAILVTEDAVAEQPDVPVAWLMESTS